MRRFVGEIMARSFVLLAYSRLSLPKLEFVRVIINIHGMAGVLPTGGTDENERKGHPRPRLLKLKAINSCMGRVRVIKEENFPF